MLLHKRVKVLDKFAEVLEQGNTDVLLELIQVEKISQGRVLRRFEQLKQSATVSIEEIKAVQSSHCGVEREPEVQRFSLQEGSLEGFETSHELSPAIQVNDCSFLTETSKCSAGEVDAKVKCMQTQSRAHYNNACEPSLNACETQKSAFPLELGCSTQICQENEYQPQADPSHSHVLLHKDGVCLQDTSADLVAMMCDGAQVLSADSSSGTENVQEKGLAVSKNKIAVQNKELSMLSNVIQHPLSKNAVPSKEKNVEVTLRHEEPHKIAVQNKELSMLWNVIQHPLSKNAVPSKEKNVEVTLRHEESHKKTGKYVAAKVETSYNGPKNEQNTKQMFIGDMENERIKTATVIDYEPKASSWSSECPGGYSTVYTSLIFEDVKFNMGCLKLKQEAGDSGSMQRHELASNMDDTNSNKEKALEELPVEVFHLKEDICNQLEVEAFQRTVSNLTDQLVRSSSSVSVLEEALQKRDVEIQQYQQNMQLIQDELDLTLVEKFKLVRKVEDLNKEGKETKIRIDELMAINEELLAFTERKENEVALLTKQVSLPHDKGEDTVHANCNINVDLQRTNKTFQETFDEVNSSDIPENKFRSKLEAAETELAKREEALERMALHLASVIEGHDTVLRESEMLHATLCSVQHKEQMQDDQIKHSKAIIKNLEDQLREMEQECLRGKVQMAEIRAHSSSMQKTIDEREQEANELRRESESMRWRVQQLEEEIMEKEGQIAILKSSFQGEYDCAF